MRSLLGFFIIATAISSFFDLSLGSKQLLGNNVHVAETSDKRFDDVVGIDEVREAAGPWQAGTRQDCARLERCISLR